MSSMISNLQQQLARALGDDDDTRLLDLLESASAQGMLNPKEELVRGIVSMMPPFGDYEAAREAFAGCLQSEKRREAAIWSAYLYVTLHPENPDFVPVLSAHENCAVCAHMLAEYHQFEDRFDDALSWIRKSIAIEAYPKNLLFLLFHEPGLELTAKARIFRRAESLILDSHTEDSPFPKDLSGLYQAYWDELILGRVMTSVVWADYQARAAQLAKKSAH